MDITALAHDVTISLVPLLPYLFKAGEAAAEEAGKKLAGAAWEEAKKLWLKIRPQIEDKAAALEAAHEAADAPDDADAQAALRLQLKKLFTEDEALAREVNNWWHEAKRAGVDMTILGQRNIGVSGSINQSTVITGDRNVVKS